MAEARSKIDGTRCQVPKTVKIDTSQWLAGAGVHRLQDESCGIAAVPHTKNIRVPIVYWHDCVHAVPAVGRSVLSAEMPLPGE